MMSRGDRFGQNTAGVSTKSVPKDATIIAENNTTRSKSSGEMKEVATPNPVAGNAEELSKKRVTTFTKFKNP